MSEQEQRIPEAGRELDALVAERVMGHRTEVRKAVWWGYGDWHSSDFPDQMNIRCIPVDNVKGFLPEYSTDIEAAWEVLEKFPHYVITTLREGRTGCFRHHLSAADTVRLVHAMSTSPAARRYRTRFVSQRSKPKLRPLGENPSILTLPKMVWGISHEPVLPEA